MTASRSQRAGDAHERRALGYLCDHGLDLEQRNFRCAAGEIDLIMRDGDTTVFVEVRYRRRATHGGAAASIDARKCERIARTALVYLRERDGSCERPMRFDVVAIDGAPANLTWIRSAFEF